MQNSMIPQQQQQTQGGQELITNIYASTGGKPKFNEFVSPIGRVVYCYHDKPSLQENEKTRQPILDEDGIQKAEFKVTLMWPKTQVQELTPLLRLAEQTRAEAWGPRCHETQWFTLEPFLRDGDSPIHNTKARDVLFGHYYLNFKQKAVPNRLPTGQVTYTGKPGLIGPYNEDLLSTDMYAGCTARVSGIMFATEYSGKRFISTRLNNIQKAADGERIGGGGRPDARSQFDPLSSVPQAGGSMLPQTNPFGGVTF
jgi:hypothetical protein